MPALLLDRPITKAQIADSLYRQTGLVILDAESAESADPTDDKGYLIFEALLVGALLQEWAKASADLSAGLFSLASVENVARFGAFNSHHYEAEIERLFQTASERMAPAAAKLIAKGQQRIGGATKAAFARDYGPQVIAQNANATRQGLFSWSKGHIRWTSEDQQAMARLGQHTEYRIREYFEKNLASQARGIFNKSRAHLGNQAKISEVVQSAATSLVKRQSAYWQVTAINALTQARTYAGLRWMNQNLITAYRIVAVLDSVTTPICRSLHGRVFPVSNALAMYEQMAEARTVAELELLSPMVRSEMSGGKHTGRYIAGRGPSRWVFDENQPLRSSNESLIAHGLMVPPFHHGCRSRIEPVFTALTLPIANNPMATPPPIGAEVSTSRPRFSQTWEHPPADKLAIKADIVRKRETRIPGYVLESDLAERYFDLVKAFSHDVYLPSTGMRIGDIDVQLEKLLIEATVSNAATKETSLHKMFGPAMNPGGLDILIVSTYVQINKREVRKLEKMGANVVILNMESGNPYDELDRIIEKYHVSYSDNQP